MVNWYTFDDVTIYFHLEMILESVEVKHLANMTFQTGAIKGAQIDFFNVLMK